jgi:hypothetical protein
MRTWIRLTPEQSSFVEHRIRDFDQEATEAGEWQLGYVAQFEALPLFYGWTETLALQPDGSLVRWSTEAEYEGLKPIERLVDCALALVRIGELDEGLRNLIPPRPHGVVDCPACLGIGRLPQHPDLICECGGLGWRPRTHEDLGVSADEHSCIPRSS